MGLRTTLTLGFLNVLLWLGILVFRPFLELIFKPIRADPMLSFLITIILIGVIVLSGFTANLINFILIIMLVVIVTFLIFWVGTVDYLSDILRAMFTTY